MTAVFEYATDNSEVNEEEQDSEVPPTEEQIRQKLIEDVLRSIEEDEERRAISERRSGRCEEGSSIQDQQNEGECPKRCSIRFSETSLLPR
jgi:hypothetical protein